VVTRSIPDYSVVFGMPATVIRQYDPVTQKWRMGDRRGSVTSPPRNNTGSLGSGGSDAEFVEKSE
jgi:hypothetical protein